MNIKQHIDTVLQKHNMTKDTAEELMNYIIVDRALSYHTNLEEIKDVRDLYDMSVIKLRKLAVSLGMNSVYKIPTKEELMNDIVELYQRLLLKKENSSSLLPCSSSLERKVYNKEEVQLQQIFFSNLVYTSFSSINHQLDIDSFIMFFEQHFKWNYDYFKNLKYVYGIGIQEYQHDHSWKSILLEDYVLVFIKNLINQCSYQSPTEELKSIFWYLRNQPKYHRRFTKEIVRYAHKLIRTLRY